MKHGRSARLSLIAAISLIISIIACKRETGPETPPVAGNLVFVTDNDPASYLMIQVVGKVRSAFPDINITWLPVRKFNIPEGAFVLKTAARTFPEGTVLAGLVEPGAKGKRLVYEAGGRRIFAPDNTISTRILHEYPGTKCYFVENTSVLGGMNSEDMSFGDFYAFTICSLLSGAKLSDFGSSCEYPETFPVQDPVADGDSILGEILFTDNFGNCLTNIPDSLISSIPPGTVLTLHADSVSLKLVLGFAYNSVPVGDNVCFVNSSGLLEIAVNYGNFSEKYGLSAGSRITLLKSG